jgi:hypothetical protein
MVSSIMLRGGAQRGLQEEIGALRKFGWRLGLEGHFINVIWRRSGAIQRKLHIVRFEQLNLHFVRRQTK